MFSARLLPVLRRCARLRGFSCAATGSELATNRRTEEEEATAVAPNLRRRKRWSGSAVGPGERYAAAVVEPGAREPFVFPEFIAEEEEEAFERRLQEERVQREEEEAAAAAAKRARAGGADVAFAPWVLKAPPEEAVPVLGERCPGCGAMLQCLDPAVPGFVLPERAKRAPLCQRCFLLQHHQRALRLRLPPNNFRQVLRSLRSRPTPALVLLLLDLLDLPGLLLLPDLPELLLLGGGGRQRPVLVLGNKVDLLPADRPGHLRRLRLRLLELSTAALPLSPPEDVLLISAKTGYGVEELITRLQRSWRYKGDVYLLGATNAGKSTLFNALLQSDYCKSKAPEVIDRATISSWPGTTLNLLKFPIINPTPYRMFRRQERLKADEAKFEDDLSEEEQKHLNILKKQGYLIGRVGRTFQRSKKQVEREIAFDPDSLSFDMEDDGDECTIKPATIAERVEFTYNELKDAHWFYDTPGIVKEDCVLNLLNENEVKMVLPLHAIIPRTFVLQPGMTLFLGALGRIDFIQGDRSAWFSVIASNLLPVHVTSLEKADDIYQKHAGNTLLGIPIGGEERMKEFPPLVPQDITLEGAGTLEAVADIKLSTTGWVAVTAHLGDKLYLRAYTPEGSTIMKREPPLLPYIVQVKGERIKKTPAYKTKKPVPLVSNIRSSPPKQPMKKQTF